MTVQGRRDNPSLPTKKVPQNPDLPTTMTSNHLQKVGTFVELIINEIYFVALLINEIPERIYLR